MKFETLKKYNNVLTILYREKAISARKLKEITEINYNTIHTTLKTWVKEGFVEKKIKDLLLLGGDRYEFSLTEKGIKYVRENLKI